MRRRGTLVTLGVGGRSWNACVTGGATCRPVGSGPSRPLDVLWAGGENLRCIQFKRFSARKAGDDGGRRPCGAVCRITFAADAARPICLGHASHFGMGLFCAAEDGS